jgi:hypothetical protein
MYGFLLRHLGRRTAFWLTAAWYVSLVLAVLVAFGGPAAEFRYGHL